MDINHYRHLSAVENFDKDIDLNDLINDVPSLLKGFIIKHNELEQKIIQNHEENISLFDFLEDKSEHTIELQNHSISQNEKILEQLKPKKKVKRNTKRSNLSCHFRGAVVSRQTKTR